MGTKEDLIKECESFRNTLERFLDDEWYYHEEKEWCKRDEDYDGDCDIGLYGYLQDCYDYRIVTDIQGNILGCRIMVAGGGPNIYINTETCEIEGYWGADEVYIRLDDEICVMIDKEMDYIRGGYGY